MTGDRVLALDVGTQSVRAMVLDPAGNLLARAKVPIEQYVPGPPGCCGRTRSCTGARSAGLPSPVGDAGGAP
jgi:hypothetical protein